MADDQKTPTVADERANIAELLGRRGVRIGLAITVVALAGWMVYVGLFSR